MTRRFRFQSLSLWTGFIRILSICAFLCCSLPALAQEIVSTPFVPSGPTSGASGTLYQYTASGSTSSLGNAVQYSFDWGDGHSSGWTPTGVTMSFHAWSAPRHLHPQGPGAILG